MTEGGEAHGGRHKCYSPGEGSCATQKKGKHTGHTHGEKLTQRDGHMKKKTTSNTIVHNSLHKQCKQDSRALCTGKKNHTKHATYNRITEQLRNIVPASTSSLMLYRSLRDSEERLGKSNVTISVH